MLFQSQFYVLVFLPVTVALYYAAAGSAAARQWVLIAASLFFYGWWDPRFIILVVIQITASWLLARAYEHTGARAWLVAGVMLNSPRSAHSNISISCSPRSRARVGSRCRARISSYRSASAFSHSSLSRIW